MLKNGAYLMFFLCPRHGHCWGTDVSRFFANSSPGFHVIYGSEGRKDAHAVFFQHLKYAPKNIFCDHVPI